MLASISFKKSKFVETKIIGEGLNSYVYRAFRVTNRLLPNQEVAVKVFKSNQEVRKLEGQFQKLVKVRSRYCVGYLGWECIDNKFCIIMDYVAGVTLAELMQKTELTQSLKKEIVAQIQMGLKELHHLGICHGDLSPHNILVGDNGTIKLIDYGFGDLQKSSTICASPKYLSPERWLGEPATEASDIFGLGLLAEEMFNPNSLQIKSLEKLQERSLKLALKASTPWLHLDIKQRGFSEKFFESDLSKQQLSKIVLKIIRSKSDSLTKTQKIEGNVRIERFSISWLYPYILATFALIVPFQKGITQGAYSADRFGSIEVRSLDWIELKVNDNNMGFLQTARIPLRAGVYKIRWRTKERSGEILKSISPGELWYLTDKHL